MNATGEKGGTAMPVFGVTGLPCSGKSFAAELLAAGAVDGRAGVLVKADDLGHEVLLRPEVVEQLRERFGGEAFRANDPAAIRRAIAQRVFADREELLWLEGLVHPLVVAETERIIAGNITERPVVVEAALLFEAGMDKKCSVVFLIDASLATRRERAAKRGWDAAELERRECRQRPLFAAAVADASRGKKIRRVGNDADAEALLAALRQAGNGLFLCKNP